MRLIKDVPTVPLQKQVFSLLRKGQDKPVHGKLPEDGAPLPYITLEAVTGKPLDVKDRVIWRCSLSISVWGTDEGKEAVYEAVSDIVQLLSFKGEKLEIPGYDVLKCAIDLIETFPEERTGYHGAVTVLFDLMQNVEKEKG